MSVVLYIAILEASSNFNEEIQKICAKTPTQKDQNKQEFG